jgi:hypothetical protein
MEDDRMKKLKPLIFLLLSPFIGPLSQAEKLTTPTFIITITSQCEEGVVNCDKVGYTGINRKTGKSISLEGSDLMHYCPDDQGDGPGNTPCHHIGYEFKNGNTTYLISDDGDLIIRRGKSTSFHERGVWSHE